MVPFSDSEMQAHVIFAPAFSSFNAQRATASLLYSLYLHNFVNAVFKFLKNNSLSIFNMKNEANRFLRI